VVGDLILPKRRPLPSPHGISSDLSSSIIALAEKEPGIDSANGVLATHLAPDQVVVALSLEFSDDLRTPQIEKAVRALERSICGRHPEVVALFVKPQSRSRFGGVSRRSASRGAESEDGPRTERGSSAENNTALPCKRKS
jgi:hypothetical protein